MKAMILRVTGFVLCILLTFQAVNVVLGHSNTQIAWIHAFRAHDALNIPEDTIDVLAIGTSPNISGFSPMEAYGEYGFSSFSAGVGFGSGFEANYILLQEILKTQNPSVVCIEMRAFDIETVNTGFRVVSDAVGISESKIEILMELPEDFLVDSRMSYMFPILKYHSRYKNITKEDFFDSAKKDYYDYFQGFKALHGVMNVESVGYPMVESEEVVSGNEMELNYLQKMIDLCKKKGIAVVLYKMPHNAKGGWNESHHNGVKAFADENNIPFVDLNLSDIAEEIGFDLYSDFNDAAHLNFFGAIKATRYLAKWLDENYNLPDRRGDSKYEYLDEELERYEREKHNEEYLHVANLSEYLNILCEDPQGDYTALISVKDEASKSLGTELQQQLHSMGFESDLSSESSYRHGFIGVWSNGEVLYEKLSEGSDNSERDVLEYRGTLPDGMKYYIKSAGWLVGNVSSIVIDGKEYSTNVRGINIVIYDNITGRVVDSISFDTYAAPGTVFTR